MQNPSSLRGALFFVLLFLCSRADPIGTSFNDIKGKYIRVSSSLRFCTDNLEVTVSSSLIHPGALLFDNKTACTNGPMGMIVTRSKKFGKYVRSNSKQTIFLQCDAKNITLFEVVRPIESGEIWVNGMVDVIKGALYLHIETSYGSCLYIGAADASRKVISQSTSLVSQLRGNYEFVNGNIPFCTRKLDIWNIDSRLLNNSLLFNGEPRCTANSFLLKQSREKFGDALQSKKDKLGPVLWRGQGSLVCSGLNITFVMVSKPLTDVVFPSQHLDRELTYLKGNTYFELRHQKGECRYIKKSSIPSVTLSKGIKETPAKHEAAGNQNTSDVVVNKTEPSSPTATKNETRNTNEEKGQHETLWLWLGPVLGAFATIIGSFIGVFYAKGSSKSRRYDDRIGSVFGHDFRPSADQKS